MADIEKYSEATFENIRHTNEYGQEFWYARELQQALEYSQWRRFEETIERAKTACLQSENSIEDHFANVGKMVSIGSGAQREIDDIMLSRYACYLIVMNGDPRKQIIAVGQTYFAVKTRQQELVDNYDQLTEDQKRLAIRDEIKMCRARTPPTAHITRSGPRYGRLSPSWAAQCRRISRRRRRASSSLPGSKRNN